MADKEEGEETSTRGAEWEVVQLTASTYAAAPGPEEVEPKDGDRTRVYGENEAETSLALFMSGHFVFPPSQHENLPLEPEYSEIKDGGVGRNVTSEIGVEESEKLKRKESNVSDEIPRIQFFDDKVKGVSVSGKDFEESTTLPDLNLSGKEQSIYSTAAFSSFHSETGIPGAAACEENRDVPEVDEPSESGLESPPMDISLPPRHVKDGKYDGSSHSCEAWWKRGVASLYNQAKEANPFWSIFVAAAVMGLVLVGQRWQQEKWQVLQTKWQVCHNNEKNGGILGPITRLKDVIVVGGHQRGSLIRGTSPSEN